MSDHIQRTFTIDRGHGYTQQVYYTTYSRLFDIYKKYLSDPKCVRTNYGRLAVYLAKVFLEGFPDYKEKKSISGGNLLQLTTRKTKSDLITMASEANYEHQEQFQHRIVQRHLMKNDKSTIATEVPVWDESYHGHIDIIRLKDENYIEVADFKPKAKDEKKAASQVYRYCHILSLRTGIPLEFISGIYFDNKDAYSVTL